MFQFMGDEIALVPAGEARTPRKDLPVAARLYHPYVTNLANGGFTQASPVVIAVDDAGLSWLSGVFNACFMFSALTAA
ncbi:hypothetical protein GP486_001107 [Trichoglossum hirsutum]|uniref:Uncharacterized protein n=1 Tax=Trichoglossum hirsutum TaxID=265104 RepID=A0A9P8RSX2_9PEZI|nr:hypothetical protein GP486_001107 [Trichoglossum hirsutum]